MVDELLQEVVADTTFPTAVRSAITARLHDVLWAMDHINIGGPGAVEVATERLLGQIVVHTSTNAEVRETSLFKRTMKTLGLVWIAYKAGPEAAAALEGWQDILRELPPGLSEDD